MNRLLLAIAAIASALLMMIGLLGVDGLLAEGLRTRGVEGAAVFARSLGAADAIAGIGVGAWLAGWTALALGTALVAARGGWRRRWARILVATWAVQVATLATAWLAKPLFGRLRPDLLLALGESPGTLWFAGGDAFPSGHTAFWFGLLLPLAAASRPAWLRVLLLALAVSVAIGRIGLARHYLSDVAASALLAALYGLLAARWLARIDAPASASRTATH